MRACNLRVFATYKGVKYFYPRWDANGEIIPFSRPTAAVSVDQGGKTFPQGSTWLYRNFGGDPLTGVVFAEENDNDATVDEVNEVIQVTHTRSCVECGDAFSAKRKAARYCSPRCRQRSARSQASQVTVLIGKQADFGHP